MVENAVSFASVELLEAELRADLAHEAAIGDTVVPILRHLLANRSNSLFSEELVARVRGMIGDVAVQLLDAAGAINGERGDHDEAAIGEMTDALLADAALVSHVHALALEGQLIDLLQARLSLDPVLTPLVQALIASPDADTAALAMNFLAAQSRFIQALRRMKLPLSELPPELLIAAIEASAHVAGIAQPEHEGFAAIRSSYDEARTRRALIERLIAGMGGAATAALDMTHAGVAIFLSALSVGSGQPRDLLAQSAGEVQIARLALSLRAAGMKPDGVAEQFLSLVPDVALPEGFDRISADRAAAILAAAGGRVA